MKYYLYLVFIFFTAFKVFSQQPVFEWANQCGNPPNTTDTKTVLASDFEGQFYLSGEFLDTTQFGDKMLISSGGTDIFLVKHTEDGIPVWADRLGGEIMISCRRLLQIQTVM